MYISLLRTTSDPEQLRTLAIAMVQKVMAENAELQNRIRIWEEQLKLTRQQRFGKKCESLAGMQRSLFEEDVDADIAEISAHLDRLLPQSGDEEKRQHVLFVSLYPHIFPGLKRLSCQLKHIARNVMKPCTSFAMKSARKWNISPHRLWSTAMSVRSTAVPAVRKCSAEKCRHISFRKVLLSHRSSVLTRRPDGPSDIPRPG